MKKAAKVILSSAVSMAVCASLIAGSTFALFTSESKTNIAITSGKVAVASTASITRAYSNDWNEAESKYVETEAGNADGLYTFTNTGTAKYEGGMLTLNKITPGDCVDFTITSTNSSTIAIKYRTVVTFVSGGETKEDGTVNDTGKDTSLFHALNITVDDMKNISSEYSTAVSDWSDKVEAGGPIKDIKVSIQFPTESKDDNKLQNKSCKIAIGVYAVQYNGNDETKENVYLVSTENVGDALNEAKSGDTLVLGEDLAMPEGGLTISGGKEVNVDLFGNTFGVSKDDAESGEDLVVEKESTLTVKDSAVGTENKFTVDTNVKTGNALNERDPSTHGTEDKKYTMKVEGELNFEGVDVEVNNKQGDIGICVDGGTVNFDENTELSINGRNADDGYGTVGFGKGFYVTDGGKIKLDGATVESEGAVTSFVVGGGTEKSTLTINGGTYNFKNMYNSITYSTFVSAFQTYENGTINIEGADLNLTGKAMNNATVALGGTERDTEYTNMILISTMGGGDVNVNNSKITLAPELGTAFVAQTVCSYYYEESVTGCEHGGKHRGVQCDACVMFSDKTEIYLNSAGHQTDSDACYVFAASRNGKQLAGYEKSQDTYDDELKASSDPLITRQVAAHEWEKPADGDIYTIKVASTVNIFFSNVGPQASDALEYYQLEKNDDQTGKDSNGTTHEHYYLYDLSKVKGGADYFVDFINRYNPEGVLFDYDLKD